MLASPKQPLLFSFDNPIPHGVLGNINASKYNKKMKNTFVVESSNPSNDGKTHLSKLVAKTKISLPILGEKEVSLTRYISAPNKLDVGTKMVLDITEWNNKEYDFEIPEGDDKGKIVQLTYLHLKPGVVPMIELVEEKIKV